jgi:hypothetical protein
MATFSHRLSPGSRVLAQEMKKSAINFGNVGVAKSLLSWGSSNGFFQFVNIATFFFLGKNSAVLYHVILSIKQFQIQKLSQEIQKRQNQLSKFLFFI